MWCEEQETQKYTLQIVENRCLFHTQTKKKRECMIID